MKQKCVFTAAAGLTAVCCACMTGSSRMPAGTPQEVHVYLDGNATYVQAPLINPDAYGQSNGAQAPEALLKEITEAYRIDAYAHVLRTTHELLSYPSATADQRAQALTHAGAICFVHGEAEKARAYFQEALQEDPDTFPEERIRTTAMVEIFLDVRKRTENRPSFRGNDD